MSPHLSQLIIPLDRKKKWNKRYAIWIVNLNTVPYFINFYFLVDPFNVNPVTVKLEKEAGEFEQEIRELRPHGGGDCPEYTFHGIREALFRLIIPRSPMYVFTDAGPKDATALDVEEVKLMVQDYNVVVNFLTTGIEKV